MIYTENNLALDEATVELTAALKVHPIFQAYYRSKERMMENQETAQKREHFDHCKREFEKIADYGKYAPDLREKRRAVQQAKRNLDLDERVAEFRKNETALQEMLDEICRQVSECISPDIKVDAGNPFFQTKGNHCGGGCHVG